MYRKYNSRKTVVDGIKFDSKKEAARYKQLKVFENSGVIQNLRLQVKYTLIPSQYEVIDGKKKFVERECAYYADFVYDKNGKTIVEDTKGMKTPEYIIKRKLMLFLKNIKIKEV